MALAQTLDFELEIEEPGAHGLLQVNVLNAPGGDATVLLDPAALPLLPPGAEPPATLQEARILGGELFAALFQGEIRTRYDVSRRLAEAQNAALRIRLRIEPAEVAALPWELLFDARSDEFLALSRSTPIVRYIPSAEPLQPITVQGALNLLLMGAAPADLPPVDLAQERQRVEEALAPLRRTGRVTITWLDGQSEEALRKALQTGEYHVFHYIGHARLNAESGGGELLLTGDDGLSAPLDAGGLRALLRDHTTLNLAVLNACEGARGDDAAPFSSLAAQLVQGGLPAVIAMQREITVDAAGRFTSGLYGALASNLPLDAAVAEARKAMRSGTHEGHSGAEWSTPVLYLRARDGRIWGVKRRTGRLLAAGIAAALMATVGMWALIWFWALPTFFPTQMPGEFDIAVAEIGVLQPNGSMRASELGSTVSRTISTTLAQTYDDYLRSLTASASVAAQGSGLPADRLITIWHDGMGRDVKNVRFGMMEGATPAERSDAAAHLAARIGAEVVVYGHVVESTTSDDVVLEFYYATPAQDGEPDATAGNHTIGQPISSRVRYSDNQDRATLNLRPPLLERTQVLFWITQALSLWLNDQPEEALSLLNAAEGNIRWNDDNGRDLFEVVRGQSALLARDLPQALEDADAAVARNPAYLNALLLKGQALYDWAQLYYLRDQPIPDEMAACINVAGVDSSAATLDEARAGAAEAVATLEEALARAETEGGSERTSADTVTFLHMSLGMALRVAGYTLVDSGDAEGADAAFLRSIASFESALDRLSLDAQPQYVGWTLAALAATQEAQWDQLAYEAELAESAGDAAQAAAKRKESLPFLRQAVGNYEACVALEEETAANPIFQSRVLACACKPYLQQSSETLSCLEGGPCNQ
jgi:hypothetical protein